MGVWDLPGRCAVVLGGTSGIGKALALGLAGAGADVVASSRSEEHSAAMAAAIEGLGRQSLAMASDVCNRGSLERLCAAVEEAIGPVDILVNCAGRTQRVPTLTCSEELWEAIFEVNLNGTLRGCQVFGRGMLERGSGRIINIASLSTYVAFHEVAPYGASKAAVGALTRSLAVEWAGRGGDGKCDRAGDLSYGFECGDPGLAAGAGAACADANGAVRGGAGVGFHGAVSGKR